MANSSASASATKTILVLVVVATLIFTLPTVMVLIVGMIPTFIAYATDRRKEKYKTVSVGSLNFVGVLPLLVTLWTKIIRLTWGSQFYQTPSTGLWF